MYEGERIMEKLLLELKKLEKTAGREVKKNPLKMDAIRKLIACLRGKEKPSAEALNRLALLFGFQDWATLRAALHGTADGEANYEDGK
ncbi:MAG: hypothetical protein PUC81_08390 [Prevotellaceae bacterium]|nr:hypothetical protein [Prevotella sp.]MDD5877398.1 hypothetical protein [Prevotellaceae bacterium]